VKKNWLIILIGAAIAYWLWQRRKAAVATATAATPPPSTGIATSPAAVAGTIMTLNNPPKKFYAPG
jgi:hypothetical protein